VIHALLHAPPVIWLIAAGLFAWWRFDVELHPFAPCRQCKGSGTNRGSRRGAYGLCPHGPRRVRLFARSAAARQSRRRQ
jgi:hypothetical protein